MGRALVKAARPGHHRWCESADGMYMISPEEIFVNDFDALQAIIDNPTNPNLLAASAILRRLLIDSQPILHRVNKSRGLKIRFKIVEHTDEGIFAGAPDFMRDGLIFFSPYTFGIDKAMKAVSLDEFLKSKVTRLQEKSFSVSDLIRYAANNAGGVHYDPPAEGHRYGPLNNTLANVNINGVSMSLFPIRDICRIVVEALDGLYSSVRA